MVSNDFMPRALRTVCHVPVSLPVQDRGATVLHLDMRHVIVMDEASPTTVTKWQSTLVETV
jgi:hypothetical protein